jgi:hypothetical protein
VVSLQPGVGLLEWQERVHPATMIQAITAGLPSARKPWPATPHH